MSRLARIVPLALAVAAAASASAQELNLARTSTARPNVVALRTGMEHAFVGELGYRRVLAWGNQQLFVGGDVAVPWAEPDLRDYRVRATVGAPIGGRHWKLSGWISPTLRGTGNVATDMTALGVDLRLAGGYYARRWFAAAEVGADWNAATRVALRDAYRTRVYSGAKYGWNRTPGGTTYAGLQAGLSFSSYDVVLRTGLSRTTALDAQTVPFYLTTGLNKAW
jgi:hypothetical protein